MIPRRLARPTWGLFLLLAFQTVSSKLEIRCPFSHTTFQPGFVSIAYKNTNANYLRIVLEGPPDSTIEPCIMLDNMPACNGHVCRVTVNMPDIRCENCKLTFQELLVDPPASASQSITIQGKQSTFTCDPGIADWQFGSEDNSAYDAKTKFLIKIGGTVGDFSWNTPHGECASDAPPVTGTGVATSTVPSGSSGPPPASSAASGQVPITSDGSSVITPTGTGTGSAEPTPSKDVLRDDGAKPDDWTDIGVIIASVVFVLLVLVCGALWWVTKRRERELNLGLLDDADDEYYQVGSVDDLPPGWQLFFTEDGTPYYWNETLGLTQWEHPGPGGRGA